MIHLINPNFKHINKCVSIADYMEEHIYNTVLHQLQISEEEEENGTHEIAVKQVVAILAHRTLKL